MYNATYVNEGSRSQFYQLDDKRGFKEFDDIDAAEYARTVQYRLAQYNLAPMVLSEVGRIRNPDKQSNRKFTGWGFITEIAEMIGCGGNECDCGECEEVYDRMYRKVNNLRAKISNTGYEFMDAHPGNVGYVKRKGKKVLVCIDTGAESVSDDDIYDDDADEDCISCNCSMCQPEQK